MRVRICIQLHIFPLYIFGFLSVTFMNHNSLKLMAIFFILHIEYCIFHGNCIFVHISTKFKMYCNIYNKYILVFCQVKNSKINFEGTKF